MIVIPSGVIFIWTGTHASIPTGWERVTALDGLYSKGTADATNPNQTGGAATHEHSASASHNHTMENHTHTMYTAVQTSNGAGADTGSTSARSTHTHANATSANPSSVSVSSVASTYASFSNDPPYYKVIFITPTDGVNELPNNAIYLYDNTDNKTGHYLCDGSNSTPNLVNKYLKGAGTGADAGGTGGSTTNAHTTLTHTHSVSHTHTFTAPASAITCGGYSGTGYAPAAHAHNTSVVLTSNTSDATLNSQGETVEPAYKKLLAVQNQNTGATSYRLGMIGMWLGYLEDIPNNYILCDGTNGTQDMRSKHLKLTATTTEIGNTGGSNTHTHAAQGHTHTVSHSHTGSVDHSAVNTNRANNKSPVYQTPAAGSHDITSSTTDYVLASANTEASESNNEPAYRTVAFIKLNSINTDFVKAVDDTITVAENLKRATGKFVSETITAASSLLKGTSKTLKDAISLSSIITFARGFGILFLDAVSYTESLLRGIGKNVLDSVSITESVSKGILRGLTELVNYVDTTTKSVGKLLLSSINIQETISFIKGKVFTEVVNISESFTKVRSAFLTFLETISITETILKILDKIPGIGNWLRVHSHQDTPPAVEGDSKPTSGEGTDKGFMSSSEDTPTGTILNEDRPSL